MVFMAVREGSMGKPMPGWFHTNDAAKADTDGHIWYEGDERRGMVVKAFVVLNAGHEPSDELADEIKAYVREHHSASAYPQVMESVTELPKTLTGKIRRIELRQRELEDKP